MKRIPLQDRIASVNGGAKIEFRKEGATNANNGDASSLEKLVDSLPGLIDKIKEKSVSE